MKNETDNETKSMNISVDKKLHTRFKTKCVKLDVNMYDQVKKLMEEWSDDEVPSD